MILLAGKLKGVGTYVEGERTDDDILRRLFNFLDLTLLSEVDWRRKQSSMKV